METFTVTPEDPHYRVVGETGLVWGTYTIAMQPKGGEAIMFQVRSSRSYIKADGLWQLFLYHVSAIPDGN